MQSLTAEFPARYSSTVGGVTIGWDMCGACHRHVVVCTCEDGPSEPAFLAAERTSDDPPFAALRADTRAAA